MTWLGAAFLLFAAHALGAAYSTSQAGNWSQASTWGGAGVPGNGDTATINHAVTVNADVTVGTSGPNGSTAVVCSSPGSLTVASGTTFTLRGDLQQTNCAIALSAGSTFQFDSTQSASPPATQYKVYPSGNYQSGNRITVNGTAGSRVAIRSASGGGNGYFSADGKYSATSWSAAYVDFLRIGDSTKPSLVSSAGGSSTSFQIEQATFDTCGPIGSSGTSPATNADFKINDTAWTNTQGVYTVALAPYGAKGAGVWEVKRNYFDKMLGSPSGALSNFHITHNVLTGTDGHAPYAAGGYLGWDLFEYNVAYNANASTTVSSPINSAAHLYLMDNADYNPHYMQVSGFRQEAESKDLVFDGLILHPLKSPGDGDGLIFGGDDCCTITLKHSIVLPNSSGLSSNTLGTLLYSTSARANFEHNTLMCGTPGQSGIQYNETQMARVGQVAGYRSNLLWCPVVSPVNHFHDADAGPEPDNVADPSTLTHNTAFHATVASLPGKSSDGTYYGIATTGAVPGANDVNVDPQFTDTTRNLLTWAQRLHGSDGTLAGALAVLRNGDRSALIPELLSWVRAGFAPRNAALGGAAHDGGDIGAVPVAQAPPGPVVITPQTAPVVKQGSTYLFTANRPVNWSLAPGSQGTIDADGTYHAPAAVTPKQKAGGCQMLPNNHVFNTRIDTLPVHPRSTEWIQNGIDSSGGRSIKYGPAFGLNLNGNSTPQEAMNFLYTPANDGLFPIAPWPALQVEAGYFTSPLGEVDRHITSVNRETCSFSEIYNKYPAGTQASCPACTAQSGVQYSGMSYALPTSGATDAAGMPLTPLVLRLEEIRSGAINHALRFTRVHPDQAYLWPATSSALYGYVDGRMQMGARLRLKGSFDISTFSSTAQVLLTQLKQYGIILADAGLNWDIQTDLDVGQDAAVRAAFDEIRSRVTAAELEVVDESGLMAAPNSGETASGATIVIATDQSDPNNRAQIQVALQGITVGVPEAAEWIQAGASKQFTAWVHGTSNNAVTWSMSPAVGTLTTGGLYTAPSSVASPTKTTLTARSSADANATATIVLTVMPAGPIRIDVGSETADYGPDAGGNMWWRDQSSRAYSLATDDFYGVPWPAAPDIRLYHTVRYQLQDWTYRFTVPNGNYRIKAMFAEATDVPAGKRIFHLESQGQIARHEFDISAAAGGVRATPVTVDIPAKVVDGSLYFTLRRLKYPPSAGEMGQWPPVLNAFQIEADASAPGITIDPPQGGRLTAGQSRQFHAVGWYMANTVTWAVTSGPGTIDANGLYRAPTGTVLNDTPVTITATSTVDGSKTATTTLTLTFGTLSVTPGTGTMARGITRQFTALVDGQPYSSVSWSVFPPAGQINASGVYTAPDWLAADTTVTVTAASTENPAKFASATVTVLAVTPAIRINCGTLSGILVDGQGNPWHSDYGYSTPTYYYSNAVPIAGAPAELQPLYQSSRYRYSNESFWYSFPVPNGSYRVTLKFADYTYDTPGHYNFDVALNGQHVLTNFDPDAAAGASKTAIDRTFDTTVGNKSLRIDFIGHAGGAIINGIEVIPLDSGQQPTTPGWRMSGAARLRGKTS